MACKLVETYVLLALLGIATCIKNDETDQECIKNDKDHEVNEGTKLKIGEKCWQDGDNQYNQEDRDARCAGALVCAKSCKDPVRKKAYYCCSKAKSGNGEGKMNPEKVFDDGKTLNNLFKEEEEEEEKKENEEEEEEQDTQEKAAEDKAAVEKKAADEKVAEEKAAAEKKAADEKAAEEKAAAEKKAADKAAEEKAAAEKEAAEKKEPTTIAKPKTEENTSWWQRLFGSHAGQEKQAAAGGKAPTIHNSGSSSGPHQGLICKKGDIVKVKIPPSVESPNGEMRQAKVSAEVSDAAPNRISVIYRAGDGKYTGDSVDVDDISTVFPLIGRYVSKTACASR